MFTKMTYIKEKIRGLCFSIFNALENNGNTDFFTNGENLFIDNLVNRLEITNGKHVILDIGANVGSYTQMLLDKLKETDINYKIHLFEPTSKCFDILNKKFQHDDVVLNNIALSDKRGQARIYYDKEGSGLASLYHRNLNHYAITMAMSEEINLERLDRYINRSDIKHLSFVKIDIEGHEMAFIEGLGKYFNNDFIDFIQFEYGGANLDSHTNLMELFQRFQTAGFKVAKIMPHGLEIRTYHPYMENFQYSNYVALSEKVWWK